MKFLTRNNFYYALACIALLAGLRVRCAEKKLDAAPAPPGSRVLAAQFESNGSVWKIPADRTVASKSLQPSAGTWWDMRKVGALGIKAERAKSSGASARLRWLLQSRVGGWYLSPPTPLPINGAAFVTVNCLEDAGELTPIGHQRPWDALSAAEVVAIELRVECTPAAVKTDALEILLNNTHVEIENISPGRPRLLDLALESPPTGSRAQAVVTFRIHPLPADPYAPNGDGDVRVKLPGGAQALAFLDQDVIARDDGSASRLQSSGLPYWRAYLPEWTGNGSIEIVSGKSSWKINCAALGLMPANVGTPASTPAESSRTPQSGSVESSRAPQSKALAHPRWETPLEASASSAALEMPWTGSRAHWRFDGENWNRADALSANAEKIWRPVPFWNATWGEYAGARRPDPGLARQMDLLLEQAAASGDSRALAILDGGALERQGVFNWAGHPLNGKLAGPGELFRTPEGFDFCARWMRYCIARYAHFKSVNALWMTTELNAPGASEFHAKIAPLLKEWRGRGDPSVPLLSFHPLAQPAQIVKDIGSFEQSRADAAQTWRADQRLGAAMGRIIDREGLSGSHCFDLRAQNTSTTAVAATLLYALEVSDYRKPADDNFHACGALMFDVWTPTEAPHDLRIGVHLRDRDGQWFQALLPGMVRPGDWTSYAVDLTENNAHKLTPVDPRKVWTDYSRQRITEIGLHIYSTHPNWKIRGLSQPLNARFDNIRGVNIDMKSPPFESSIALVDPYSNVDDKNDAEVIAIGARTPSSGPAVPAAARKKVARGELFEMHVRLNKTFGNPFDPRDCDLMAVVTAPSGKSSRVPLFFNQRCERREQTPGGVEIVDAVGSEFFTLRYRAQETGAHAVRFELREGGRYDQKRTWENDQRFTPDGEGQAGFSQRWPYTNYPRHYPDGRRPIDTVTFVPGKVTATLDLGPGAFNVEDSAKPFHGFVRAAADHRHFEFDDGSFFYPIGPCLRSPSDSRIPYHSDKFDHATIDALGKRGTYQYDEYFDAFAKAGINWARVWMCSWWGALEWRRDWPGYQGLGRYNLLNAWRMDYVVSEAEKHGIYLNLAITNHGQFTLNIDTEWKNNPYNARFGGPIHAPCEIFTRGDAKIAHQNKLRYVAARYGHSPNVMAFALFSELEFTEEYDMSLQNSRGRGADAPAPHMEAWHAEMATFLKQIDPNRHLIATHFSHPTRGEGTLMVPQIDIATSNAYSAFAEWGDGINDASCAIHDFWDGCENREGKVNGFKIFNKPALIEEQGRHWMGMDGGRETNTKRQLDADLHAGLWGSMVVPLSGATGYWWWLHVHFDNRYGDYRALAKFMEGEDFRHAKNETTLEPVSWKVRNDELYGRALKSDRRVYAWIYSPQTPYGDTDPAPVADAILKGSGLKPGKYRVEFWDTYKGERMESRDVDVLAGSTFNLKMPVVNRDLAVKIKPAN